jgi:hypothetical protein
MDVPDSIWEWGQRHFNTSNPAPHLRNMVIQSMVQLLTVPADEVTTEIDEVIAEPVAMRTFEQRRNALGITFVPVDPDRQASYVWGMEMFGGEEELLTFLEEKAADGINNPMLFLIALWAKRSRG